MAAKIISFLLMVSLLAAPAAAEIVGQTPQDEFIHRYIAPNGQEIYYISREDEWATVQEADVNFDGQDDLVFLVTLGASNGFFEFWLRDGEQYILARRNEFLDTGIPNYELYPELRFVTSYHQIGWAGLLHEKHIFRWEGNSLKLVRYAVCREQVTSLFEGDTYIRIENQDRLVSQVYECRYDGFERSDELIYEKTVSMSEGFDEQALLAAEDEALWNGLR